jgi:hypothetical protein
VVTEDGIGGNVVAAYGRKPPHVLMEDVGGELVLLDLERSLYCSLNGVGSRMFVLAQEKGSLEEVVQALTEEYDADAESIRADLADLIDRLVKERLLIVNG